jgi:hypothetical protein
MNPLEVYTTCINHWSQVVMLQLNKRHLRETCHLSVASHNLVHRCVPWLEPDAQLVGYRSNVAIVT